MTWIFIACAEIRDLLEGGHQHHLCS